MFNYKIGGNNYDNFICNYISRCFCWDYYGCIVRSYQLYQRSNV